LVEDIAVSPTPLIDVQIATQQVLGDKEILFMFLTGMRQFSL